MSAPLPQGASGIEGVAMNGGQSARGVPKVITRMEARSNMYIYEIDQCIQNLLDNAVDPETGEITADIAAQLDSLAMDRDRKVENAALAFKNLSAVTAALKAEEKSLAARRKAAENKATRVKTFLSEYMVGRKFETARVKLSWRKASSVSIVDEPAFVAWAKKNNESLLSFKPPEVNKTATKEAIQAGEAIPGAEIITKDNLQIK